MINFEQQIRQKMQDLFAPTNANFFHVMEEFAKGISTDEITGFISKEKNQYFHSVSLCKGSTKIILFHFEITSAAISLIVLEHTTTEKNLKRFQTEMDLQNFLLLYVTSMNFLFAMEKLHSPKG
jgi:hypothetical protein